MSKLGEYLKWYGLAALVLAIALTQVAWPHYFAGSRRMPALAILAIKGDLLFLTPLASWLALRSLKADQRERTLVWAVSIFAACYCEVAHFWIADQGHLFSTIPNNTSWQVWVQNGVLSLNRDFIPHSYRFLPNCIVALFQWLCGSFEFSRTAYRLLFNALLWVMIFRYARTYLTAVSAFAVQLVILLLYPLTILQYAGQLTDPASHLSFVVCLYCLAAKFEPGFGPGLILGIFAKESVIVMGLCRLFYGRSRRRAAEAALVYLLIGLAVILCIRRFVLHGAVNYGSISGVDRGHIIVNLRSYTLWLPTYLVTLGALLPGAVLGWRLMDGSFRITCLLITVAVIVSSLVFSWLGEVRNLLPAFVPLAVVNLKYLEKVLRPADQAQPSASRPLTAALVEN